MPCIGMLKLASKAGSMAIAVGIACIGMLKLACTAVSIATDAVSNCIGMDTGAETLDTDKLPVMVCFLMLRAMVLRAQIRRPVG